MKCGGNSKRRGVEDEGMGKDILMDLIRWFLGLLNWTSVWRSFVESRNIWMEAPPGSRSLVPAVFVYGKPLARGPTFAPRRSDL
jgi:hypothetical protein